MCIITMPPSGMCFLCAFANMDFYAMIMSFQLMDCLQNMKYYDGFAECCVLQSIVRMNFGTLYNGLISFFTLFALTHKFALAILLWVQTLILFFSFDQILSHSIVSFFNGNAHVLDVQCTICRIVWGWLLQHY